MMDVVLKLLLLRERMCLNLNKFKKSSDLNTSEKMKEQQGICRVMYEEYVRGICTCVSKAKTYVQGKKKMENCCRFN